MNKKLFSRDVGLINLPRLKECRQAKENIEKHSILRKAVILFKTVNQCYYCRYCPFFTTNQQLNILVNVVIFAVTCF